MRETLATMVLFIPALFYGVRVVAEDGSSPSLTGSASEAPPAMRTASKEESQTSLPDSSASARADARSPRIAKELSPKSAYEAVRLGNQRLTEGDPTAALRFYERAEEFKPDAVEIDFVRGLGHYALKQYDEARHAFEGAVGAGDDDLAADALYSLGTCDHAEALEATGDPRLAIERLESAMQKYRDVLDRRPDHAPARDATFKAAMLRRQIKQQLEEAEQDPSSRDQPQEEQNDTQRNQEAQPSSEQQNPRTSQDEQEQQQEEPTPEQDDSSEPTSQESPSDEEETKENAPSAEQNADSRDADAQAVEQKEASQNPSEHHTLEQATRRLREMLQSLMERRQQRREAPHPVPARPVEKDW